MDKPEFENMIIIKGYKDGFGYQFNSDNSSFFINDEDTSYLNFQITIKDLKGKLR